MTEPTFLTDLTARELLAGYGKGDFSPVDATRAVLERIDAVQPLVNAFVRVDAEAALAQAGAAALRWLRREPRGLLDGVPVSVQDLLPQRGGGPMPPGSLTARADAPPAEDAPAVARLREHGAVLVGRTTTTEFGGRPVPGWPLPDVTRNPYDLSRTSGGSSGGSAAAVALGAAPLSIGTDGEGSVRVPASFCGVFGLKATAGRVPVRPPGVFGPLAHVGPLARDAADAALLYDVITGEDLGGGQCLPPAPALGPPHDDAAVAAVRGLRVAYSPSFGGQVAVAPGVAAAVRRAVGALVGLGAYVEEADPDFADPVDTFHTLWCCGVAKALRPLRRERRDELDPELRDIAAIGDRVGAVDYLAALDDRAELTRRFALFHRSYDLLVTPVVPLTAFRAGLGTPPDRGSPHGIGWTPFTYPFNLTGQPAASVPCGLDESGLPVGLQIVGARFSDSLVLRVAHALYVSGVTRIPAPAGSPTGLIGGPGRASTDR